MRFPMNLRWSSYVAPKYAKGAWKLISLGVTAEALRAIIGSKLAILLKRGPVDQKFQVEEVAPTNHSSSQRTRLNVLSYGI